MKNAFIKVFAAFASSLFLLCSCGSGSNSKTSYDGRTYDISEKQDGSLTAQSVKNGYDYDLTISGEGKAVDYSRKEEVPWNPIAKKIENITIGTGIENIGDYFFFSVPAEYLILPESVESAGDHSFNSATIIYTYGGTLSNVANDVYYYSETQPTIPGKYFYIADGVPCRWPEVTDKAASFLFIGNSFTFRQGTEDDPAVPRFFKNIATNLGIKVQCDFVVKSSYTLTKFADPTDEEGKIVEEKLTTNQYDYVILQEQSTTPINNYSTFLTAVTTLKKRIDQTQTNCRTVLYETWGSPAGIEGTSYATVGDMELALREAYTNAGQETSCSVDYVGKAFTYAYETEGINIFADDNRHQSMLGAYLSAACHIRSIFKVRVSGCTDYCDLSSSECEAVLGIADKIC